MICKILMIHILGFKGTHEIQEIVILWEVVKSC